MEAEVTATEIKKEDNPKAPVGWLLLALLVIGVGIGIRLRFYLYNRSMYRDEAALALNIVQRPFSGLLKPLDNDQGAPVGFLMLEKLVVRFWGNHERALRLVPQVASILTLPVFYWLCRKFLTPGGAVVALLVIAFGGKQYDYSADTKQYALDVFIAVALYLLATLAVGDSSANAPPSRKMTIALAVAGALAVWFSHPAVFVLGGIGAMLAIQWLRPAPRGNPIAFLAVCAAWAASFAAAYLLVLRRLSESAYMLWFWTKADAFAPIPKSLDALIWYKGMFFEVFTDPLTMGFAGLCAMAFVLGVGTLWRERRPALVMLLLPILLALAASAVHKYPFKERLILFISPSLAICVGAGISYLFEPARRAAGAIALIFLLITPVDTLRKFAFKPALHSDMRTVMNLIRANRKPGDYFYVDEACYYPFEYYSDRFGIAINPSDQHREKPEVTSITQYKEIFAAQRGKRVWIIFEDSPERQRWAQFVLNDLGKPVIEANPYDDYVGCYDLQP